MVNMVGTSCSYKFFANIYEHICLDLQRLAAALPKSTLNYARGYA